jgi:ATP-binding cassette subfamily F protein 3
MEALSTNTLELRSEAGTGKHRLFYGNYAYYLERIDREEIENNSNTTGNEKEDSPGGPSIPTATAPACLQDSPPDTEHRVSEPETENSNTVQLPGIILVKAGSGPVLSAAEQRETAKQKQTLIRRLERQEGEILAELEKLETEKTALEAELGKPEIYSNGAKARPVKAKLDAVTSAAEAKSQEWEAKAKELTAARK